MKYFITETGLVPFDLTPTELAQKLLTNPYQIQSIKEQKSFSIAVNDITKIMDKPYGLFKYPDMNINTLNEMSGYASANYIIQGIIENIHYLFKIEYERRKRTIIITEIINENNCYPNNCYYTIHYLLVDEPIFKTWERKLTIDTILNDLPV